MICGPRAAISPARPGGPASVLVETDDFGRGHRHADGASRVLPSGLKVSTGRRLRQAVALQERLAGDLLPPLGDGGLQRHAAGGGEFQVLGRVSRNQISFDSPLKSVLTPLIQVMR
jgi:hypothetical protein